MIAYLEGSILLRDEESCVLLTPSGVGYQVHLTVNTLAALPDGMETTKFFVYTLVREDALVLYGFDSWEERQTFVTLLGAPKLGPKTALAMLGCYTPGELAACVAKEDVGSLTRIPGIGTKTARRLVLDLKDKLAAPLSIVSSKSAPVVSAAGDCAAALVSLGYSRQEVDDVVRTVFERDPGLDTSSAIRNALKIFASK